MQMRSETSIIQRMVIAIMGLPTSEHPSMRQIIVQNYGYLQITVLVLAPLNRVQIDAFLNQLPQWAKLPQKGDALLDCFENVVDFFFSGEPPDAEPDTAMGTLVTAAQRAEDVAGFQRR